MNKIFPVVLMLLFFSALAVGQDTIKIQAAPDTLSSTHYQDLIDSDTVVEVYGQDTITQFRTGVRVMADTTLAETRTDHSPKKAIMYALVLPGLGQGYNRKFFKMPIVWAAIGGAGYAISFNTKQYNAASREFADNPDDDRPLRYWRRNMELSYIALVAVYALQVIDAYVDAQLYYWDVNEELSVGISPSLQPLMAPGSLTGQSYGLTCSFNFKK